MAMTLLESAKNSTDVKRKGVIKVITERTPILRRVPWKTIKGNAYTYDQEHALPGVAFRAVGDTYPQSTHVVNPTTERLSILGGEVFIDNFIINTQGNLRENKAVAYAAKARSMGLVFSEKFFEGNSASSSKEFDGIRVRLGSANTVEAATNGAALTLLMADQLIDKVIGSGDGDTDIYLNKTLRRKFTVLGRDISSGYTLLDVGNDNFGKQVTKYNGVPLQIIERDDNEATFLDFDETQGTANGICASMYIVRFGEDYVMGIQGEGGSMEVKDFGEIQAQPGHLGRIEWYCSICILHPRAAAKLVGLLNS